MKREDEGRKEERTSDPSSPEGFAVASPGTENRRTTDEDTKGRPLRWDDKGSGRRQKTENKERKTEK
jgi:hypothetical protein